ncbi:hypothetical protein ABZT47_00205 [Sphaerisporangium sp. NPDC005289]|uniref:hypothetical protein n=1 Tax=Sphaerisporangium sp. NPDC005289 TaxID=3155247 RepID=UPI0033B174A3
MRRSRARIFTRLAVIATGLVMVALGVALPMAGLDDADKYASVLGAFTGVAGLALSAYGVVLARRAPAEAPAQEGTSPPPEPDSGAGRVRNSVSGTVHGPVLQADTFTGPITIGTPRPSPPSDEAADEREGPAR